MHRRNGWSNREFGLTRRPTQQDSIVFNAEVVLAKESRRVQLSPWLALGPPASHWSPQARPTRQVHRKKRMFESRVRARRPLHATASDRGQCRSSARERITSIGHRARLLPWLALRPHRLVSHGSLAVRDGVHGRHGGSIRDFGLVRRQERQHPIGGNAVIVDA